MDPRIEALARNLLDHSRSLQPGEKLLIEGETGCEELVRGLIAGAYARGVQPFFELTDSALLRAQILESCSSFTAARSRYRRHPAEDSRSGWAIRALYRVSERGGSDRSVGRDDPAFRRTS